MTPELFTSYRRSLSTRLITALVRMFRALGGWGNADAARFVDQAVPLVRGAQRTMADLTSAYISEQAATFVERPIPVSPIPDERAIDLRRGTTPEAVYRRPFVEVRLRVERRGTQAEAVTAGANRLRQIAEGDLQQTHAEAAQEAMAALPEDARPVGWRRVLQGADSCPRCVLASSTVFGLDERNPTHPACDCSVELVFERDRALTDPTGHPEVMAAIEQLTGKAGRVSPSQYRELLRGISVEHGELGPMLVNPQHHFEEA